MVNDSVTFMPDYYLTTPEVAEQLGWSLSTLNSRIKAGEFAQEDINLGGRYLGWSQAKVDAYKDDDTSGATKFSIDFAAVLAIIVELRRQAEVVRFYGEGAHEKSTGISVTIPNELYAVLGGLESTVRGNMVLSVSVGARFATQRDDEQAGQRSIAAQMAKHEAQLAEYWMADRIPTVTNGWGRREPDVIRAGLLRTAAHRIADEQRALRKAFVGRTAHMYYNKLSDITAKIHAYADSLAPDTAVRDAMNAVAIPLGGPHELAPDLPQLHTDVPSGMPLRNGERSDDDTP